MSHESLLDFAIDAVKPRISASARESGIDDHLTIAFLDDDDVLQSEDTDQLLLEGSWGKNGDKKIIYFRVAKDRNGSSRVITMVGANSNESPTCVVYVNGDESWAEDFSRGVGRFFKDPLFCTPEAGD